MNSHSTASARGVRSAGAVTSRLSSGPLPGPHQLHPVVDAQLAIYGPELGVHGVASRDLPIATRLAGVQFGLEPGAYREIHWHQQSEWAYMLSGSCRISAVDHEGRNEDVKRVDVDRRQSAGHQTGGDPSVFASGRPSRHGRPDRWISAPRGPGRQGSRQVVGVGTPPPPRRR
ncbi:cupin domain-containing protein [Micromonospora sp. DH14]|uniref:cupin domain-containing protein n=1 Tax=Micromonospora sp. DH14 TaxID=3040120 RepID=UPI002441DB55|nr:cupin domain-containing protein [Micromonospora sp. DH14]MDG9678985.1 cupin domain-containing protein [Micromonospora sp. DH14]